jgi:hypothetical protein
MNILRKLFSIYAPSKPQTVIEVVSAPIKTSGEYITQIAGGLDLVDGKPTCEYAEEKKNDLSFMLRCCEAEMATMPKVDLVAAPYYFERAAILLRKAKDYEREIEICESYITALERFYENKDLSKYADVRKGPRYQAIAQRILKARQLLSKVGNAT